MGIGWIVQQLRVCRRPHGDRLVDVLGRLGHHVLGDAVGQVQLVVGAALPGLGLGAVLAVLGLELAVLH
eukprot:3000066-Alexandrium_andersonii.AAC.1